MQQASARFKQYLKRRFGQSTTAKHYLSDLKIFIHSVGDKAPEAVSAEDIDVFIDGQIAAGLSPRTINRRLASLHTFFEYLASEKPEADWPNPVIRRRHSLKTGKHLPRDVPDQDVTRLFDVITDPRDRAMFSLMVGAGLRVAEVADLRRDQVEPPPQSGQMAKLRVRGKGDKERCVWLTTSVWETLEAWLNVRPAVDTTHLFLNRRGRSLSVAGIQYRLQQYCQMTQVTLSCHRLRHTFARRLAENGLPVDSLARLLGHSQLQTTQLYIDGADPTVRADFAKAMTHLDTTVRHEPGTPPPTPEPNSPSPSRAASQAELLEFRSRLDTLPPWLREALEAYLNSRWPTWRAQTARRQAGNLLSLLRRMGTWLATHRQVQSWETFRRADLEAWQQARQQEEVSAFTIGIELAQLRSLLKFLEARDWALDPGLFRVQPPKHHPAHLPRYLTEAAYRQLETTLLQATTTDSYAACFDRAWFLTLAHTGVRLSELLDLRLGDLDLLKGCATVRAGKPGRDRVIYLTPSLIDALQQYFTRRSAAPEDDHLFVLHDRSPADRTIQRRLAHYAEQAEVQVSPHRLRHTLATRLINNGMPIHSLRKLLGHQHLNTTQIYARIYDETLYEQFKAAMSRLEAIAVDDWPGVKTSAPAVVETR